MSGRIQLHIMKGGVGHLLHEDDPNQVAQIMLNFLGRIGISSEEILRIVKKVGQI